MMEDVGAAPNNTRDGARATQPHLDRRLVRIERAHIAEAARLVEGEGFLDEAGRHDVEERRPGREAVRLELLERHAEGSDARGARLRLRRHRTHEVQRARPAAAQRRTRRSVPLCGAEKPAKSTWLRFAVSVWVPWKVGRAHSLQRPIKNRALDAP